MNKAAKKRLTIMGLVIVLVASVLFVTLGSGGISTTLTVEQVATGNFEGKKVQVSGPVVNDSYESLGTENIFWIAGEGAGSDQVKIVYTGVMPAAFGNGVTAICTGTVEDGAVICTTLLTKCPSKYESAEGAVTAATLMEHIDAYAGVADVKLAGYVTEGSIADINADVRFNVFSQGVGVDVAYDGALPDGMEDGSAVIVTGTLSQDGLFEASDVALDAAIQNA